MEQVNVLVTTPIEQVHLDRIEAMGPRVKVWNISDQTKADIEGHDAFGGELDGILADADVIYGLPASTGIWTAPFGHPQSS
jgi:hypothetical protein